MEALPKIMVAPNGARLTKDDHPAIPMTIEETVECAAACHAQGADALHAHLRDEEGQHILDAGLYRELIDEMALKVPTMDVQITTEAVGRYDAPFQRHIVRAVKPKFASAGLRELLSDSHDMAAKRFYYDMEEAGIGIQHILYSGEDVQLFQLNLVKGILPPVYHHLIFVLGRYTDGQQSHPSQLDPFFKFFSVEELEEHDWSVCAFGTGEMDCLLRGYQNGGKCRIGFENSLHMADGSIAPSNEAKVAELVEKLKPA